MGKEKIILDLSEEAMCDYGNLKNHLYIRLLNKNMVSNDLERIPYWNCLDLIVICRILVGETDTATASTAVTSRLLETAGISKEQLFRDAVASSQKLCPAKIGTVSSFMNRMGFEWEFPPEECELFVVTNEKCNYGAGSILYPGVLDSLATDHNLFLIPSSIHEFLCLPDYGQVDAEDAEKMIRDVNREIVTPGEVLSDRLYYYDRNEKEIRFAKEDNSCRWSTYNFWRLAYDEN